MINIEQLHTLPYIDIVQNTETLFNLTATSPQKLSPIRSIKTDRFLNGLSPEIDPGDADVTDGVVNLSPFKSRIANKERAHRLITNIFELENDAIR